MNTENTLIPTVMTRTDDICDLTSHPKHRCYGIMPNSNSRYTPTLNHAHPTHTHTHGNEIVAIIIYPLGSCHKI